MWFKRLLEKEPENRIGAKNKDEIKSHPFFKDLDWEKLYKREYDPPLDEYEVTEQMLKPDKTLKFEDLDYEEDNFDNNRVPGYSFAKKPIN